MEIVLRNGVKYLRAERSEYSRGMKVSILTHVPMIPQAGVLCAELQQRLAVNQF